MRRAWRGERGIRRGGFHPRGRGQYNIDDPNVQKAKKLSWALRHGFQTLGLTINQSGYIKLTDILAHQEFSTYTLEEILDIVARDEKQRYGITLEKKEYWIRANQGHSIQGADDNSLLREITNPTEFPMIVHGTYKTNVESISKRGLNRMQRNHIHFATGIPGDEQVISGARVNCDVFIEIDLPKAMQDGIKFFVSENNVVLTSGIHGILAPKYFKKILIDRAEVNIKSKTLDLDYLLIFDTKFTCLESGKPKCEEIIEMKISALNCRTRRVEHQFNSYVKPELMPALGEFCIAATKVAQQMVDTAPHLRDLLNDVHTWLQNTGIFNSCWIIAVHKDLDIKLLIKEFNHKRIENHEYFNHWIELTNLIPDKNELKTIPEKLEIEATGNLLDDTIHSFIALFEANLHIYESDVQHRANKAPVHRPPYANPPLPPAREETKEEIIEKQLKSESFFFDSLLIFLFDTVKDKEREVAVAVYVCLFDLNHKKVLSHHKKLIKPDKGVAFDHQGVLGISERIYYEKASNFDEFENYLKSLIFQPQNGRCALATFSDKEIREIIPKTGYVTDQVFFKRWINLYKFLTKQPQDSENNFAALMEGFNRPKGTRLNGEAKLKHLIEAFTVRLLNMEEKIHTSNFTYL